MRLNKIQTSLLVLAGAFTFAYLTSRPESEEPAPKPSVQQEQQVTTDRAPKEEAAEQSPNIEEPSEEAERRRFSPSYIPGRRVLRPGPTPGLLLQADGEQDYQNPYADLTRAMQEKRQAAGNQDINTSGQRNLYFETLSNQLKELQGRGDARVEFEAPAQALPGPSEVPGQAVLKPPATGKSIDLKSGERENADQTAPVDPAITGEVFDDSANTPSEEEIGEIIQEEEDEAELERALEVLDEEGLP